MILILLMGAAPSAAASEDTVSESEVSTAVSQSESENYNPNVSLTVSYDYDNVVRAGFVVPAFIEIENKGAELDGEVQLIITPEYATQSIVYKLSVHVDENATANYVLPFKASTTRNIRVKLYQNNRAVAEAKVNKNGIKLAVTGLLGIMSDNPQDMAYWKAVKKMPDIYGNDTLVSPVELDQTSFPEEDYLLDRFSMLVLNHYDISKLNQQQQKALTSWIQQGGVLLTDADSANAQAVKALAPILDITVQGETELSDIAKKIYELADVSYNDQIEIKALSTVQPAGNVIHQLDGQPMLMEYEVEKGRVFVTTFSLSEPALAHTNLVYRFFGKAGMSALESSEMENSMYGGTDTSMLSQAVRSIEWMDAATVGWVLILMIAFIILVGPVNYAILAAKDKRDWIWFTAPALSIVFCAVIIGSGIYRHDITPVSSVVSVIDNRGQSTRSSSTIGIGAPSTGRYEISLGEEGFPSKDMSGSYDYYGYGGTSSDAIADAGDPLTYFDVSGETKVTIPRISRWDMDTFAMERDLQLEGGLDVEITLEKDTTLYYVKNNTGIDLEDVTLAMQEGYIRIPFLAKGEEKTGELIDYIQSSSYINYGYGNQLDYYTILGEIYGGPEFMNSYYGVQTEEEDFRTEVEKRHDYAKYTTMFQLLNNDYSYGAYSSGYSALNSQIKYAAWAWSSELGKMDIEVNGSPAKNELNLAVIIDEAVVSFENSEGLIIPNGYITGYAADVSGIIEGYAYVGNTDGYIIEGEIIYEFQLPDMISEYTIDSLLVSAGHSDGNFEVRLKNNDTGNWDSFRLNVALSGDSLQSYINENDIVQMQIKKEPQDDANATYEANFDGFTLAVEGTVK